MLKRLFVPALLLVLAGLSPTKANRACVVVDNTYVEGSCVYSDRTICCDGPESCVVSRHLKIWCIGDPPVGGNDNRK
jgi:hypothetical protein